MLKQLYIKNFTLIDELNIQMHPGFSVITGETGAGKSIILGAIGLLLGNRADSKSIKAGRDRCVIEAHFDLSKYDMQQFFTDNDIDEDLSDTIIRRELTAAGKSRAFINDTPVSLTKMRELGEQLVDIHSQHQNLLLQKEDFQLNVVDIIAQDEKQRKNYEAAYNQYKQANQKLNALKAEIEKNRENEDFLRFQFKELDEAQLQNGEQEELEQEYEMLSHSEDIKTALYQADNHLSGDDGNIIEKLKQASEQLANIKDVYPEVTELLERIDSSYIELKERLIPLGMPNVRFGISLTEKPLSHDGGDKVSFLFSANKSTPLQPVTQVASGGEIARVMLSLKAMISGAVKLPTIIFDEIDTGVSGKIAEKMAQIMVEMGNHERQVLSITHLPQIAAMGSHHYKVSKEETDEGTISRMTELSQQERIQEIAQMLSGSDVSEAALANAKELLRI